MTAIELGVRITEDEFGLLVGVTQQAVSRLVAKGVLDPGATAGEWLRTYCDRLQEQATERLGSGSLSLPQERAMLARAQREGIAIRNGRLLSEFAPRELLADVLAAASAGLVDRFAALERNIQQACPGLPAPALDVALRVIASARSEWVRSTAQLVDDHPAEVDDEGESLPETDPGEDSPDN